MPVPRLNPCTLRLAAALAAGLALGTPAQAAGSSPITVSAVVLSKSNCKFSSNAALALNFGTVDPSSTTNRTATTTTSLTCNGSASQATFVVGAGNGLHYSGASRRMRHQTTLTEFMAYSLAFTPASATVAKGSTQVITITGTLAPAAFADARSGSYQDTVSITVTP